MNFFEAISSAFSKYFQGSGRSSRSEYWFFGFFIFIVDRCLIFFDETEIAASIFGYLLPVSREQLAMLMEGNVCNCEEVFEIFGIDDNFIRLAQKGIRKITEIIK